MLALLPEVVTGLLEEEVILAELLLLVEVLLDFVEVDLAELTKVGVAVTALQT
jgi:hypothetical protein